MTDLSDEARRFLSEAIGSVQRLDLLLFLHRHAAKWWAADALADRLEMPVDIVASELEVLGTSNLLDVRLTGAVVYRYNPARPELSKLVDEIARAHFRHRNEIVALRTSSSHGARLFAEAFRLRREKKDG